MNVLYDTRTVRPPDRYEYYRSGAGAELAPVAIRGRAPGLLLAVMPGTQIGDFAIETVTMAADSEIVAHRTGPLIRACDPECYGVVLGITGGLRTEQEGSRVSFRPPGHRTVRPVPPLAGHPYDWARSDADCPADIPARAGAGPLWRDTAAHRYPHAEEPARTQPDRAIPDRADRRRRHRRTGGRPGSRQGPRTRRLLRTACVRAVICRDLGNPALGPDQIAKAASISPRYLHKLFQGTGLTPMKLVKRLRLEACYRDLQDPALSMRPVKDIISAHGYLRPDQFARDFKQLFDVSATQVRQLASQRPSRSGR